MQGLGKDAVNVSESAKAQKQAFNPWPSQDPEFVPESQEGSGEEAGLAQFLHSLFSQLLVQIVSCFERDHMMLTLETHHSHHQPLRS